MSIAEINRQRREEGMSEFKFPQDRATILFLEDAISSFERSPKKVGNRDHFAMLLSLHLPLKLAEAIAYEGISYQRRRLN